jgi:hypothetical protein
VSCAPCPSHSQAARASSVCSTRPSDTKNPAHESAFHEAYTTASTTFAGYQTTWPLGRLDCMRSSRKRTLNSLEPKMPADMAWVEYGSQCLLSSRVDRQRPLALPMRRVSITTVALRLHLAETKVLFSGELAFNPTLSKTWCPSTIPWGKSPIRIWSLPRPSPITISQPITMTYASAQYRVAPTILRRWPGSEKDRPRLLRLRLTSCEYKLYTNDITVTSVPSSICRASSTKWLMMPLDCFTCPMNNFSPISTLHTHRYAPGV